MIDVIEKINSLSQKELLIYGAVIEYIKSGRNPGDITISEIAQKAGIGKGTVYEYFKSKEEILLKTILFQFAKSFEQASKLLQSGNQFKEIFTSMLDNAYYAFDVKSANFGGTISMFACGEKISKDKEEFFDEAKIFVQYFKDSTDKLLNELIDIGVSHGVFTRVQDREFAMFAISAAISSFINSTHIFKDIKGAEYEKAKQHAYKLVVEALG